MGLITNSWKYQFKNELDNQIKITVFTKEWTETKPFQKASIHIEGPKSLATFDLTMKEADILRQALNVMKRKMG